MRRPLVVACVAACLACTVGAAPAGAQLRSEIVAQGLSGPVAFVPDPTSPSTFFIVEQSGLIRVLQDGVLLPVPLLDLTAAVASGDERGLLGMAFPPDAASSGRFFVNFTNTSGHTVIARFQRSPATAVTVNPATRVDLRWPDGNRFITQPFANHNGGQLAFGPDGYLYIGLGDGGSENDPVSNAQNPSTLLGKMLRIDVAVADGDPDGYSVPADNPFLDGEPIGALGEVWAFGLRNPWRYTFDDFGAGATGALIIGDVGQAAREEVNYEPAGAGGRNYGWRIREGTIATPGVPATTPAYLPLTSPLFDYGRSVGQTVTGGYVYRGSELPEMYQGRYFVADYGSSRVMSLALSIDPGSGEAAVANVIEHTAELGGSLGGIASFGRDLAGELYLVTFSGNVLKIVSADATEPGAPAGLTAAVSDSTVTLQWQAPAGAPLPTGYRLEAGSTSGASDLAVLSVGPQPMATVTSVPDGTYFVRVRAIVNGIAGPASNEEILTVATSGCTFAPAAPGALIRTGTGALVTMGWTASPGAASYTVEAGSAAGLADLAVLSAGASPGLSVTAPPGTYFVRVRAHNACGASAPSNEIIVQVP